MATTDQQKQMQEAEEILGDRLANVGFVKGLYFGQYQAEKLLPYPDTYADPQVNELVKELRSFCHSDIDPAEIDRQALIPDHVIRGLGKLGVLGACMPRSTGGLELSQVSYCRVLEVLGGYCGSTALFVNAHHSIGPRALVLFGTPEQQQRWLPPLSSGEAISAFALTEPEAGSDAANVQSMAVPTEDGTGFIINGQKRWITNGGIADVLTVMARTPVPGSDATKITAFLVTPDMPGFEVVEERMSKCGVRGTATSRLAFHDMFVPRENVLGPLGGGLRVALTVLDFGRTTFGASCTGAAKFCVEKALEHANRRVQFGKTLGEFELVQAKLANMAANTYAMEATTYQTAQLIDSGSDDYMLETAMLKVWSTDALWEIINDTFQIYGGKAYFTDEPYERMMRDARINMIGEGANDVLRVFVALVGMRDVGLQLQDVLDAIKNPWGGLGALGNFAVRRLGSMVANPEVPVRNSVLDEDGRRIGKLVGLLGSHVEKLLRHYRESVLDRQFELARISDAATEIYTSACVLSRLEQMLSDHHLDEAEQRRQLQIGRYYLTSADRRIRDKFKNLGDTHDQATSDLAKMLLRQAKG